MPRFKIPTREIRKVRTISLSDLEVKEIMKYDRKRKSLTNAIRNMSELLKESK